MPLKLSFCQLIKIVLSQIGGSPLQQVYTQLSQNLQQITKGSLIPTELAQLKTFIDYFTDPNWKPFFTSDFEKVSSETISKQIEQFFLDNKTSKIEASQLNVWSLDHLKLDYLNDTLQYFVQASALPIAASSSLPIKIKDRYLLFQNDSIFVLKGQEIIQTLRIEKPITEDYDIYVYAKWVNICNGGQDNWVYSYSYEKNKFHQFR